MNLDYLKHQMFIKVSLITFFVLLIATVFRPLVAQQSILFTYIGIVNTLIAGCAYLYISRARPKTWHQYILILILLITITPLMVISGGVNSQFSPILVLFPIVISLTSYPKTVWLGTFTVFILLLVLFFLGEYLPNVTNETVSHSKTIARLFWLILSIAFGLTFSLQFDRINSRLSNQLREQATIDSLTGLYNRRSIIEFLDNTIELAQTENRWLTAIMLDIDYFKNINDTYGHLAGDLCLQKVSECLKQQVRNRSDIVGRYGGEEFAVVLLDVDQSMALHISEKIRQAIEELSVHFEDNLIKITTTLGYCTLQGCDINSKEQLLKSADEAMYVGKNSGRNKVVCAE